MASQESHRSLVPKPRSKIPIKPLSTPQPQRQVKAETTYKSRAGKPKVRTGCRVCKIRHVKCDETKPACMKCVSTGRTCEGYDESPSKSPQSSTIGTPNDSCQDLMLYQMFPILKVDSTEHRSLSYFQSQVIPEISGFFDLAFWDSLAFQVSQSEPAVRYALLALSSTYEDYKTGRPTAVDYDHNSSPTNASLVLVQRTKAPAKCLNNFASRQYNKAIKVLIETEAPSLNVTLVTCLLFVCLEYLRNNFDVGLTHLKSGLKILADARHSGHSQIEETLSELFARLDIQATIHGSATSDFNAGEGIKHWISDSCPRSSFSSLHEARAALVEEGCGVFQFIRHRNDVNFTREVIPQCTSNDEFAFSDIFALESRCAHHLRNLNDWNFMFTAYLRRSGAMFDPPIALLQLWHFFATCQLECLFSSSEMFYDKFTDKFSRAVSLVAFILDAPNSISTSPTQFQPSTNMSFDVGVLAPLFFTALKCRHLPTRLRAIELLKYGPEREGMWRRDAIVEYSEWKVAEEEKGRGDLGLDAPLPEKARITGEVTRERVIGGRKVGVLRFQRGGIWEEIATDWTATMGDFI